MREISFYSLKVVQVERLLSDLDIVSNIASKHNATTSNQIIDALNLEQGSDFIQQKQMEFNSILNKQQIRIQKLRDFIEKLEEYFQQTSNQCEGKLALNSSIDQSTFNSIYSQTSNYILKS
jgi:hypothetical protein